MKHFSVRCVAFLLTAFLLVGSFPAFAAEDSTASDRIVTITDFRAKDSAFLQICVGDQPLRFLSSDSYGLPYLDENSRIQIPLRRFTEAIGGTVEYCHKDRSVTIMLEENTVVFVLGSNVINRNGETAQMDTTAQTIGGRTYIPLRALAEALGYTVEYSMEQAKSPECRISREDVVSMYYEIGALMNPNKQQYYLSETELDILVELFNQMCMSSPQLELDPFDTVRSYYCNVYGKLKNGKFFDLACRGENEDRYWVQGAEGGTPGNGLMISPELYNYLLSGCSMIPEVQQQSRSPYKSLLLSPQQQSLCAES